ncbi:hypothetical protein AcW1_002051 [Taiwanofungus camphoratus]|nr:hypothetical protein AcW1_002051 [Antrodia cinnamomea]
MASVALGEGQRAYLKAKAPAFLPTLNIIMLARIASGSVRRLPRMSPASVRFYAEQNTFNKKEKAHEDQYARHHEAEQLKKLKAEIERKKVELAELEKQHEEASSKAK